MKIGGSTNLAPDWGDYQDRPVDQVRPGETLALVASRLGVSLADLQKANPQITDPSKLVPGSEIKIPSSKTSGAAEIEDGEDPVSASSKYAERNLEGTLMRSALSSVSTPNRKSAQK